MLPLLGPIAIDCDAPPYPIVQACRIISIRSPEDVRWCRRVPLPEELPWWRRLLHPGQWSRMLGLMRRGVDVCVCGEKLPTLEKYTFLIVTGDRVSYQIGQCERCSTVFWEEGEKYLAHLHEGSLPGDFSN